MISQTGLLLLDLLPGVEPKNRPELLAANR